MPLLFPGYVFALIVLQCTPRATRLALPASSCPATCRRGCRMPSSPSCAAANTTALIVLPTKPPPASLIGFQPGERVRIRTGVFRGCFGLCENQPAHDRIRILMTLFGGPRPVEFAAGDIVKV